MKQLILLGVSVCLIISEARFVEDDQNDKSEDTDFNGHLKRHRRQDSNVNRNYEFIEKYEKLAAKIDIIYDLVLRLHTNYEKTKDVPYCTIPVQNGITFPDRVFPADPNRIWETDSNSEVSSDVDNNLSFLPISFNIPKQFYKKQKTTTTTTTTPKPEPAKPEITICQSAIISCCSAPLPEARTRCFNKLGCTNTGKSQAACAKSTILYVQKMIEEMYSTYEE